jgi:hypothetical protein
MATVVEYSQASVSRLEREMAALELQGLGVDIPTWHTFADGLVARTIRIPAGTALTGAQHKTEHLNICCGDILVMTNSGPQRITGYRVMPALPGFKRAGLAYADTYWTTVHLNPGNERDIARLEDALIADPDALRSRRLITEN